MSPRAHGLGVASAACGLLLCILPVLFIVMAGPAMLALVEVFSSGFGGQ